MEQNQANASEWERLSQILYIYWWCNDCFYATLRVSIVFAIQRSCALHFTSVSVKLYQCHLDVCVCAVQLDSTSSTNGLVHFVQHVHFALLSIEIVYCIGNENMVYVKHWFYFGSYLFTCLLLLLLLLRSTLNIRPQGTTTMEEKIKEMLLSSRTKVNEPDRIGVIRFLYIVRYSISIFLRIVCFFSSSFCCCFFVYHLLPFDHCYRFVLKKAIFFLLQTKHRAVCVCI